MVSFTARSQAGVAIIIATSETVAFSILKQSGVYNATPEDYKLTRSRNVGKYHGTSYGLVIESYTNALVAYDAIVSVADKIIGPKGDKGDKGDEPQITADEDGTLYVDGELLTEAVKDAADVAYEAAETIDAKIAQKVDKSTLVRISDVDFAELEAHGLVDPNKIYFIYELPEEE